jgi:15-cis-phytoene desaturase
MPGISIPGKKGKPMTKVIVLGGGVAGLSAAHELIERGFEVEVYDRQSIPGGKARSVPVPGTGTQGRRDLPGEHGFRFFPGFYKHVTDTMKRIPFAGNAQGVFDNLTPTSQIEMALFNSEPIIIPADTPLSINGWIEEFSELLYDALGTKTGLTEDDCLCFAGKVWQIMTSCEARRLNEYESVGWWQFVDADNRSLAYQNIFAYGLTRSLVAAKANLASSKTVGDILVQLLLTSLDPFAETDRVLDGPTNEVWIEPWLEYLRSRGVRYTLDAEVVAIECDGKSVQSATIKHGEETFTVSGDCYIAAVPVEVMARWISDTPGLLKADASFADIQQLACNVSWMNGAQFYLKQDVKVIHGHVIYADAPWALTSISQHQFWPEFDFSKYGDGTVQGILSIDISEWEVPGILYGKAARDCTREEIKEEIWAQLKKSLNHSQTILRDEDLHSWYLDSDIVFSDEQQRALPDCPAQSLSARTAGTVTANREPLLVNLVHTWNLRPQAHTNLPNLFLASDYVQTFTDLATMEGANEAARRAVNCIIDKSGRHVSPCQLWKLQEPLLLAPLRAMDQARFEMGLPWQRPFSPLDARIESIEKTVVTVEKTVFTDVKNEAAAVVQTVENLEGAAVRLIDKIL